MPETESWRNPAPGSYQESETTGDLIGPKSLSERSQSPPSLPSSLPTETLEDKIKQKASALGFDLVGIAAAEPSVFAAEYRRWIANGYAGEMSYMARNIERRLDPREIVPDAKSIIVVGMNYYTRDPESGGRDQGKANGLTPQPPSLNGKGEKAIFARYARGDDYHDVMTPRLHKLLEFIKAQAGAWAEGRVYVDTGPVLEREAAQRAGLGWFGKNTMLINTRRGSYFFLGEIITNVALTPDEPAIGSCGTCTRCLDACPTNAFIEPFVLDSRRCISYLTIELKGPIPDEFVPAIAETKRVYGCDICQEVCPFNRDRGAPSRHAHPGMPNGDHGGQGSGGGEIHGASPTGEPAFQPREITTYSTVHDIIMLTEEQFRLAFRGSPVKRAKFSGLIRNVAAALIRSSGQEG